ncbi:lipoate--protein ligase family protein [bacterium]|nr:lipoate--protein ligase family protein [bacterium]
MRKTWQWIDTGKQPGSFNMAFDEYLAAEVGSGLRPTTLRFFQWHPYCISLGKHQNISEINSEKAHHDGLEIVFRPTGGRAILHAQELTYSIVYRDDIRGSVEESHAHISTAIAIALRRLGYEAYCTTEQTDFKQHYRNPSSALCFSSSAKSEIQIEGKKVVGSAQRRYAQATLQHGSILIGDFHRKLADYIHADAATKNILQRVMNEKTTELNQYIAVDIATLKESLREAFSEFFSVDWTEGAWQADAIASHHQRSAFMV